MQYTIKQQNTLMIYSRVVDKPKRRYLRCASKICYEDDYDPKTIPPQTYPVAKQQKQTYSPTKRVHLEPIMKYLPEEMIEMSERRQKSKLPDYDYAKRVRTEVSANSRLTDNVEDLKQQINDIQYILMKDRKDRSRNVQHRLRQIYVKVNKDEPSRSGHIFKQKGMLPEYFRKEFDDNHEDIFIPKSNKFYFPTLNTKKRKIQDPLDYKFYTPDKIKVYEKKSIITMFSFRRWRKVAHAVLFTIYLRKFNERMRKSRKENFDKFVKENLRDRLIDLKMYLVEGSRKFIQTVTQKNVTSYLLQKTDSPHICNEKIKGIQRLVRLQLNCLDTCIREMQERADLNETIYYLCKHGSYACLEELFTTQQLDLLCISETQGYIRANKHLERSNIVLLVFFKIFLFNIFLQPQKIDFRFKLVQNTSVIANNIKLVGNIIYELLMEVQDDFISKTSAEEYDLGNWMRWKNRFPIKPVPSMTVKDSFYKANELISGLLDQKYIKATYKSTQLNDQKKSIVAMVMKIHQFIAEHHRKIRQKHYLKMKK